MSNNAMIPAPPAGVILRDDGQGGREIVRGSETSTASLAAGAEMEVKARYAMARQFQRNDDNARILLLKDCARPQFADVAIYSKPVGGGKRAEGLSIRFAEAARSRWGNLHVRTQMILNDSEQLIMRVSATDLETNNTEEIDVPIEKTVERRNLKEGQVAIRSRINSTGDLVYLVAADEGSLLTKRKAEEAKAKRQVILAMIPGDILDECKAKIKLTQRTRDAEDPTAARKALFDAFAGLGIMPKEIEDRYLGHAIETTTPDEMFELRAVFAALRDGEVKSWSDVVAAKNADTGKPAEGKVAEAKSAIAAKADKLRGRKPDAAPPPQAQAPAAPAGADDE
jgi:hypothetical protein